MSADMIEFWRARLAETEAMAKRALDVWEIDSIDVQSLRHEVLTIRHSWPEADFFMHYDPARALAEVAADLLILAQWEDLYPIADSLAQEQHHGVYAGDGEYTLGAYRALMQAIRCRVAVHSTHPDYLEEWAP